MVYSTSTDESSFFDLKLQDWYDFEQLFSENLSDIREEVQALINGISSFLRGDSSETQTEIQKMCKEATKLKQNVDNTLKEINQSKHENFLDASFKEIVDLHLNMEKNEVEITDDYRNLRQSCLKALSQFSDDFLLDKIRALIERLSSFGFISFPENMLIGFESKKGFKQELTSQ